MHGAPDGYGTLETGHCPKRMEIVVLAIGHGSVYHSSPNVGSFEVTWNGESCYASSGLFGVGCLPASGPDPYGLTLGLDSVWDSY